MADKASPALGAAAAAWARTHRAEVPPWRMRYREAGRGTPIVLVHGLGVSADYWYRNGPALAAAGHRVLAPDLPGFGRTDGPPVLGIVEQSEVLGRWADALTLEPAVYVGHSLSCQVVLELAAARPELVRGLVLAAPTGDPHGSRLLRQAVGLLRDIPRESPRLILEVARAYLQAGPVRVFRTWLAGSHEDPMPLLPRIQAPARVVVGTHDPVVRPEYARALADALCGGRVEWLEGAAHALIFTHAEGLDRVILELASG